MYGLVLMAAMAGGADTAAYDMPGAVGGGCYGGGVVVVKGIHIVMNGYPSAPISYENDRIIGVV